MGNEITLFMALLMKLGFSDNVIPLYTLITAKWLSGHYNKGMSLPLHATSTLYTRNSGISLPLTSLNDQLPT
jgi:hypothetical protein